tara:strand:- start:9896 stop:10117 length:222 start_codon:yes stop_codon:yes gene_type:complete
MNLEKVLEIANECVSNEVIPTEELTLTYFLDSKTHRHLDEELFYKTNNNNSTFNHNKEIEVNIAGVTFIFKQK